MVFNSIDFFIFIAVVAIIFGIVKQNKRWILLLISSLVFVIFANPLGLIYIGITSCSVFFTSKYIYGLLEKSNREVYFDHRIKLLVVLNVVLNFGILFVLKYFNFLASEISENLSLTYRPINFIIPLGISFYTFQSIAYLIDVKRGMIEPQSNYLKFLLFVSYFPQMLNGPINRYNELSEKLYNPPSVEYNRCKNAIVLFFWGLFKKICIADNLIYLVNKIYLNYEEYNGLIILVGAIAYAIYIYSDFSGCIDMARGVSKYFGIEMSENFNNPYFSYSVPEFWRKWHISLTMWFKDYLMYPLQRSKAYTSVSKKLRKSGHKKLSVLLPTIFAILVVWLTTGIWHGANFVYLLWGGYYGLIMSFSLIIDTIFKNKNKSKNRKPHFYKIIITFIIVCIGYIFFNSQNIESAFGMLGRLFNFSNYAGLNKLVDVGVGFYKDVGRTFYFIITIISILILFINDLLLFLGKSSIIAYLDKLPKVIKYLLCLFVFVMLLFMINRTTADFTYMNF